MAAVHSVTPGWVSSIHGAEVWALQMATINAAPGAAFRTDCFAVLQTFFWREQGGHERQVQDCKNVGMHILGP